MFDRFTPVARQVVARAQDEARSLAHPWIGTEHLLLGVLEATGSIASSVLADAGVTAAGIRGVLEQVAGRGDLCNEDAAALRSVGIDLDEVRRAAEANFGPGVLDQLAAPSCRRRRRLRKGRRRRNAEQTERPFMPRAKRAFERARREAVEQDSGVIDVEQLLLGLLDPKGNMAVELMRRVGADPEHVRAVLRARLRAAA